MGIEIAGWLGQALIVAPFLLLLLVVVLFLHRRGDEREPAFPGDVGRDGQPAGLDRRRHGSGEAEARDAAPPAPAHPVAAAAPVPFHVAPPAPATDVGGPPPSLAPRSMPDAAPPPQRPVPQPATPPPATPPPPTAPSLRPPATPPPAPSVAAPRPPLLPTMRPMPLGGAATAAPATQVPPVASPPPAAPPRQPPPKVPTEAPGMVPPAALASANVTTTQPAPAAPAKPPPRVPTVEEIDAALERAVAADKQADIALLSLYRARRRKAAGAADTGDDLRRAVKLAAGLGLKELHAEARLDLGEEARAAGDLTTACEHWQLARAMFEEATLQPKAEAVAARMKRFGCPTDWVLNDF